MEISKLTDFLDKLDKNKINYNLAYHTPPSVMVIITVPGERWEVEFGQHGEIDIEKFKSDGHIYSDEILNELFTKFHD